MCRVMEDMRNEAAREAAREATLCIARRMLKIGKYSYEDIADVLKISVAEVKALDESQSA